jgi:hypothetical protein|tara:strand:- start:5701 stop:6324 length:624 start_codon:yes stop_codon:yes gene_type:complete
MITTEKDFVKAVLRVWEIGDLIPRVVEQLSNPSPLRNKAKDCETLISLGKELCELSTSIPSPGQRLICENGMINTEAENANRDDLDSNPDVDVESITEPADWDRLCEFASPNQRLLIDRLNNHGDRIEAIEKMLFSGIAVDVPAAEIDAMSDDEIDASVPDSVAARGEELVKVKATSSPANDLLLSVLTGHTEVFKAGMKAQKELDK